MRDAIVVVVIVKGSFRPRLPRHKNVVANDFVESVGVYLGSGLCLGTSQLEFIFYFKNVIPNYTRNLPVNFQNNFVMLIFKLQKSYVFDQRKMLTDIVIRISIIVSVPNRFNSAEMQSRFIVNSFGHWRPDKVWFGNLSRSKLNAIRTPLIFVVLLAEKSYRFYGTNIRTSHFEIVTLPPTTTILC